MRKNRFYFENLNQESPILIEDRDLLNQLKNVLRSKLGDIIYLFDGQGLELKLEIVSLNNKQVELKILDKEKNSPDDLPKVNLYLAILKKENFELAVQKAVEVGVTNIFPLITDHTVKLGLKEDRLKLIIKEASEQSGRYFLPTLNGALTLDQALAKLTNEDLNLFCDLPESRSDEVKEGLSTKETINIFIGPEGGWSDREKELARQNQLIFYQLGPHTLRAETAAIVSTWSAINKKL